MPPIHVPECEVGEQGAHTWWGIQYRGTSEDYDGVSEWQCQQCTVRYGRWSQRLLRPGEIERRYGRG